MIERSSEPKKVFIASAIWWERSSTSTSGRSRTPAVFKVSIATRTVNMAWDPDGPELNRNGTVLEAITKDQLRTGLSGQLRQGQGAFAILQRAGLLGQTQPVGSLKGSGTAGGHTAGGQSLHGCAVFMRCDQSGLTVVLRLRTGCHDAAGQHHDGGHAERGQLFQIHGYYLPFVS